LENTVRCCGCAAGIHADARGEFQLRGRSAPGAQPAFPAMLQQRFCAVRAWGGGLRGGVVKNQGGGVYPVGLGMR
jgi:hypothetical protein